MQKPYLFWGTVVSIASVGLSRVFFAHICRSERRWQPCCSFYHQRWTGSGAEIMKYSSSFTSPFRWQQSSAVSSMHAILFHTFRRLLTILSAIQSSLKIMNIGSISGPLLGFGFSIDPYAWFVLYTVIFMFEFVLAKKSSIHAVSQATTKMPM